MAEELLGAPLSVSALAGRIAPPFSACVISKRNSGKSVLVRELARALVAQGKIKKVIAFTSSVASAAKDYGSVLDSNVEWDEALLAQYIADRKTATDAGKARAHVLLVLDDLAAEGGVERSLAIKDLYANGRHYGASVIFLNQMANSALTPTIKTNSDWIFFSKVNLNGVELLHKFLSSDLSKPELHKFTASLCAYTFGVSDETVHSDNKLLRVKAENVLPTDDAATDGSGTDGESDGESVRSGGGESDGETVRSVSGGGLRKVKRTSNTVVRSPEEHAALKKVADKMELASVKAELEHYKLVMADLRKSVGVRKRLLGRHIDDDKNWTARGESGFLTKREQITRTLTMDEKMAEMQVWYLDTFLRTVSEDGSCAVPRDRMTVDDLWYMNERKIKFAEPLPIPPVSEEWKREHKHEPKHEPEPEPMSAEEEAMAVRHVHEKLELFKKKHFSSVIPSETVSPRAGAGLSAEDMLAAQMSAASLEEL